MYKGWKLLTKKDRLHLEMNGIFVNFGHTTYAIDRLAQSHKESQYPLCEECKRILVKLGYQV